MKIPKGYTEAQVLEIIEKIVNTLASSFRFGYMDVDDLKQEGRIFALELIEKDKYDPTKPLENFLYTHVRNRYLNFKRDKFSRYEPPCYGCPFFDPKNLKSTNHNQCSAFANKNDCEKWDTWSKRNSSKRNLLEAIDLDSVHDEKENNMRLDGGVETGAAFNELVASIDEQLPIELRSDYLRMRQGQKISNYRATKVREAVKEILRSKLDE